MKIQEYAVKQQALSQFHRTETQSIRMTVSKQEQPIGQQLTQDTTDLLELSDEGVLASEETEEATPFELSEEDKAKIKLLEDFMSYLTGKKVKIRVGIDEGEEKGKKRAKRMRGLEAPGQNQQVAFRMEAEREVYEAEKMSFSSKGVVKTADGREINFSLNLNMEREYYEKNKVAIEGSGALHDPLVFNWDGKGVDFGDKELKIDLNLDGEIDTLPWLRPGNGLLTLDKNGNGTVDDGRELFGAETGDGFAELAAYDDDGNGWIDENDAVFSELKIWGVDSAGNEELLGLKDADVGAIYLGAVQSQYHLKEGDELLGRISQTSAYLKESGGAGTIHQVDYEF